jgi:hypothetical protein
MKSRGLYLSSVIRTLAFYGTVVAVCLVFPIFVCLGVGLFFLRFYRRPIGAYFQKPPRPGAVPREGEAPALPEGITRRELIPPGEAFPTVE